MRCSIVKILIVLGLILIGQASLAQPDQGRWRNVTDIGEPLFSVQTVQRFSDDPQSIRLDLFVEIMNDLLQFVRENDHFVATAELSMSIIQDKSQIIREIKYLDTQVDSYEKTNSRKETVNAIFSVDLLPGEYQIKIQMIDRESRRRRNLERTVKLKLPKKGIIDLSDIMLTHSTETDQEMRLPLHPLVSGIISEEVSTLHCYFDLFRSKPTEVTELLLVITDKGGQLLFTDSLSVVGGETLSSYFMTFDTDRLISGKFEVLIRAISAGTQSERTIEVWANSYGLPMSIKNIDMAIQQMKYIATTEEIRKLEDAFPSDKERLFIEFWNDKFEVQGQLTNGKLIEYYQRVSYANENFGNARAGWETDRGQIWIIYGAPSEVERYDTNDQTAPYEIWIYPQLNKRFLFRDEYGFGEYRLETPIW